VTANAPGHPYIPSSAPHARAELLAAIGVDSVDDLYASIPDHLRMHRPLRLPAAIDSEQRLARHVNGLLAANTSTDDVISFLGYGCYPHYVPAVCSEVNGRAEFLTAYAGETYEDHGKWQAIFEYVSLMADLLEMDVVTVPTYDGLQAAATALRMAVRMTGRAKVLVSAATSDALREKIATYLDGAAEVEILPYGPKAGAIAPDTAASRIDSSVAAVLVQSPNVFGVIETGQAAIAAAAHAAGALFVVSADPISLGFLEAPAAAGADIVCGDIQALGLGMHYGGAHGGYLAVHDEERFIFQLPSRLFGLAPTARRGELGFTDVAYERTSLARREEGVEWVGTAAALWAITAAVYLSTLGPHGLAEIGDTVAANTRYAIDSLRTNGNITLPFATEPHWREFVVQFGHRSVTEVNDALLQRGIFGGADMSAHFPDLHNAALFCVTEQHSKADIDDLVSAIEEICR